MSSYYERHPYKYGRHCHTFPAQRKPRGNVQSGYDTEDLYEEIYGDMIPPLEALRCGLLHSPRNVNVLPHGLYEKPSLIDFERWNRVMDDLREQGAILPWDVAFANSAADDPDILEKRHVLSTPRDTEREIAEGRSRQARGLANRRHSKSQSSTRQPPSMESKLSDGDGPSLRAPEEAVSHHIEEVAERDSATLGFPNQSEHGVDKMDPETAIQPQCGQEGATWGAVFRDYGRIVSRVVYSLAGIW